MNANEVDLRIIQVLRYPEDAKFIASLSLEEKICWYAGQDAREMIFLAQKPEFKRFWYWSYVFPLRMKRFAYKIKRFLHI